MNTLFTIFIIALGLYFMVNNVFLNWYKSSKKDDYRITSGYIKPPDVKKDKGTAFEYEVFKQLMESEVLGKGTRFIANALVPTREGSYVEIDLIAITPTGIYIFELKNYGGFLYGSWYDEYLDYQIGTQNFKRFNPILQNYDHQNRLREYLFDHLEIFKVYESSHMIPDIRCAFLYSSTTNYQAGPDSDQMYPGSMYGTLATTKKYLQQYLKHAVPVYTKDEIDDLFNKLYPLYHYTAGERENILTSRNTLRRPKAYQYYLLSMDVGERIGYPVISRYNGTTFQIFRDWDCCSWDSNPWLCKTGRIENYISGPFYSFEYAQSERKGFRQSA